MKRGEVWTVAGKDYAGKPRPAVLLQDGLFESIESATICPLTTNPTEAPAFRPSVEPTDQNGLHRPSRLMVDKITTLRKSRLGTRLGRLSDEDLVRLNRALLVFLGLAGSSGN